MFTSLLIVMGVLSAGVVVVAVVLEREIRTRQRVDEVWTKVADRLGGTFNKKTDIASGFHQLATSQLTVSIVGREVIVDSGDGKVVRMRLSAADAMGDGLVLAIQPKSAVQGLTVPPGTDKVRVGDRAFDAKFAVKANGEHLARVWLDGAVRRAIAAAGSYGFIVSEGKVTAHRAELEGDETRLIAAITATARLAGRCSELGQQWRDLGRRLGKPAGQSACWRPIDVSADSVSMHIVVESELKPGCQTVVSAQPRRPSWERFALGSPRPDWARKLRRMNDLKCLGKPVLSEDPSSTATWVAELREQLENLQARGMSFDGRCVQVGFEGIVLEEQTLRAAIEFVAMLCKRMDAEPYR